MAETKAKPKTVRCPTEQLLRSKALAGYQKDFASVLLPGPEYTVEEARSILDQFFKKAGER
ncbi:MAG: hypothetical protein HFF31_02975 [Flavonifractor sp.]|jgi:hypothetical protein|nr:hypothetical protein [uncultured Oscillibacter sp.]MCI9472951.1 hypothetical protein [Flavonifractor sp.]